MYWLLGGVSLVLLLVIFNHISFKRSERRYPARGKFIDVDGCRLHYYSSGNTGGQVVVFLHGGILTAHDFHHILTFANEKGYRAFAFDRPGYGYSDRNKQVTPEEQARLIRGALKKLGVDRPIIVGHSWSGILTLSYALEYPDELEGVVTLAGGMYAEGYPAEKGDPISNLVTAPLLGSLILHTLLAILGPPLAKLMIRASFAPETAPVTYLKEAKALWLRPKQFRANREDVLHFVPCAKRMAAKYAQITVPLVIALGADDPFETREHSTRLHQDIPHSQLVIWEQVAHMIPQLHPHHVWDAIDRIPRRNLSNTPFHIQEVAKPD